jgi:hypothetical protein
MLYAVICYNNEDAVFSWTKEQDRAVMDALAKAHEPWERAGKLKPSLRLMPTTTATTFHKTKDLVVDGPYAETKEALLGFYIIDVENLEEGLAFCRDLTTANPSGTYELRPILLFNPGAPIETAPQGERPVLKAPSQGGRA